MRYVNNDYRKKCPTSNIMDNQGVATSAKEVDKKESNGAAKDKLPPIQNEDRVIGKILTY